MKIRFTHFFTIIGCFIAVAAVAQSDELDSTFGVNGKVTTTLGSSSTPYSIAVQSDKKIVVAGASFNGANSDFALARYKTNGRLDKSFGKKGKVITDLDGDETGRSVNLWNGKIVVAGTCSSGFCLIRYSVFGSVDSSFGDNGKTITDFKGEGGYCFASVIQTDGKIIAAGYSGDNFVIVRYNVNGKIDKTFGVKGVLIADSANGSFSAAQAVCLQPDGKIVAAGYAGIPISRQYLVVRCNSNGTLDSTFGTNGKTYTSFSKIFPNDNLAFAVTISAAGRIYAAGLSKAAETNNNTEFSIARYKTNGKLDKTFSGDGKVLTDFDGLDDGANAIVVMPSGKIIAVGTLYSPNLTGILRYTPLGALDASFGNNGKLTTNYKRPTSAVLQSDGKLLVSADDKFTIVRYKAENTPLTAAVNVADFSNDGVNSTGIILSPNPAKDVIKINNLDPSIASALSVADASGRVLLQTKTADKNYTWNIRLLRPGVYYLHIVTNKKIIDLKFVKE